MKADDDAFPLSLYKTEMPMSRAQQTETAKTVGNYMVAVVGVGGRQWTDTAAREDHKVITVSEQQEWH